MNTVQKMRKQKTDPSFIAAFYRNCDCFLTSVCLNMTNLIGNYLQIGFNVV